MDDHIDVPKVLYLIAFHRETAIARPMDSSSNPEEVDEMSPQINIKILVLGPLKSGKTAISNYLADSQEALSQENYRPTQGVRIVEFESNQLEIDEQSVNAEVELWDCSGDRRFEGCWPAIRHRSNGAIFVCNPEDENAASELAMWHREFGIKGRLPRTNLLVLLHHAAERPTNDSALAAFRLPKGMESIACKPADLSRNGDDLRLEFNNFLCGIIAGVRRDSIA